MTSVTNAEPLRPGAIRIDRPALVPDGLHGRPVPAEPGHRLLGRRWNDVVPGQKLAVQEPLVQFASNIEKAAVTPVRDGEPFVRVNRSDPRERARNNHYEQ